MPLIKRYPNRKLYDTQNNKYINLDTITLMVRDGEEVQVVDNVTHEDLTAVTFAQIIMEREKRERDFVPRAILAELIKAGGESLISIRQKLSSSADLLQQVDHEISFRLEALIQRGEIAEEEGKKLRDKLIKGGLLWLNPSKIKDEDIIDSLIRQGVPTKNDLRKITSQLEELSEKLDGL